MFESGPLFKANYELIGKADIVVNQGGTDSGKTFALIQLLCWICCFFKAPAEDPICSVLSESIPNSKKGPYRIFESLYNTNRHLRSRIAHWDRAGRVVTFKSGWVLEFLGATDEQNAKQGKRQFLFVNEANGIPWLIFWQMAKRTRQCVFIDYNPTAPFWAHDNLIGKVPGDNDLYARVQLLISDHRHNPFLSKKDHDRTENIKDPELWRVYARGLTGKMTGLIYNDWTAISVNEFPWDRPKFGAVDFGYTIDPTAQLAMRMIGKKMGVRKKLFVHELAYETGISNAVMKANFKGEGGEFTSSTPIYSELDHGTMREMRLLNLLVIPAIKGNVPKGIHFMKTEFDVFYTATSKNLADELRRYKWDTDPNTGHPTNEPVDKFNHCLDAARYGGVTHCSRQR